MIASEASAKAAAIEGDTANSDWVTTILLPSTSDGVRFAASIDLDAAGGGSHQRRPMMRERGV